VLLETLDEKNMETTITISDLNVGTFLCSTSTEENTSIVVTHVSSDALITLTNS
jgi:hypothetical protein